MLIVTGWVSGSPDGAKTRIERLLMSYRIAFAIAAIFVVGGG
jgi:hypothetical protein